MATLAGRDKGQLARLTGGLRDRGLLDARTDEVDRRNIKLQLTAEGPDVQQSLHRRARKLSRQSRHMIEAITSAHWREVATRAPMPVETRPGRQFGGKAQGLVRMSTTMAIRMNDDIKRRSMFSPTQPGGVCVAGVFCDAQRITSTL